MYDETTEEYEVTTAAAPDSGAVSDDVAVTVAAADVPAVVEADTGFYDVVVSDSVTVYSGVLTADTVSLLGDFVEGCTDEYYAGVLDEDSLFLIIAKGGIDSDTLQASDCVCFQLDRLDRAEDATDSQFSGWSVARSEQETVQINNALNFLAYSSLDGYPHLIEGGENYAFAQICLLSVVFALYFVNLIFSHVGHRGRC